MPLVAWTAAYRAATSCHFFIAANMFDPSGVCEWPYAWIGGQTEEPVFVAGNIVVFECGHNLDFFC